MKNKLLYYYNIYVPSIIQKGNNYFFTYRNNNYLLQVYTRNLEELSYLYELSLEMNKNNFKCHQIILTKNNNLLIIHNNNFYILLKLANTINRNIDFNDILRFNYIPNEKISDKLNRSLWNKLWEDKVDYFEYQFIQMKNKYTNINESIHYYIGLWENAISYYNNINLNIVKNKPLVVGHKRINGTYTLIDFYNPLNFIVDHKERDIGDYIKSLFFLDDEKKLKEAFNKLDLSTINIELLITRLLFPSFYFDLYEKIINDNLNERLITNVIEKTTSYELFLKSLFFDYQKYGLVPINWLKKKN